MGILKTSRRALLAAALTALLGVPAFAQMEFSGEWAPVLDEDNAGNPYVGEFIGIPMSHAGMLRAQAWNASLYTLPEWQCRPHGAMYISRGPSQVRIWKEVDPDSREIVWTSRRRLLGKAPVTRSSSRWPRTPCSGLFSSWAMPATN